MSQIVLDKILYTAHATATAGRDGRVRSDDGALDVAVAMPTALGGNGGASNPEQLFAGGYAACFGSAIGAVARRQKLTTGPIQVTGHVKLGAVGEIFGLAVELEVALPELPRDQAQALIEAAHQVCPYSNATRGNIAVEIRLA